MEISRDNGGLSIKSRPIRLNIDTFESRNSVVPTAVRSIQQSAEKGRQAAYQATATYAQQGELLLKTQIGEELVTQFAADTAAKDVKTNIGIQFLPWVNQTQFKFIPGDIEISVKQQPDVIIKYIGGPLYVPPSADPDHEPIDVQA